MTRFYDLDAANALVPEIGAVCGRLRDQRDALVDLRDELIVREGAAAGAGSAPAGSGAAAGAGAGTSAREDPPEVRRLRLRIRGLVDQMQAEVAWLDERSIQLRDIGTGLLDVAALVSGRQVWLCWRLGETGFDHWHELDAGFAGRRPISDLA